MKVSLFDSNEYKEKNKFKGLLERGSSLNVVAGGDDTQAEDEDENNCYIYGQA